MDRASITDQSLTLDLPGRVPDDIACHRCGYNLRNLARDGVCPECGFAIRDSHDISRQRVLRWSQRMTSGLRIMGWAIPLAIAGTLLIVGVLSILVPDVAGIVNGRGKLIQFMPTWPLMAACWMCTVREPLRREPGWMSDRRVVRLGLVLLLMIQLAPSAVILSREANSALIYLDRIGSLLIVMALLSHGMSFAQRMAQDDLRRDIRFYGLVWSVLSIAALSLLMLVNRFAGSMPLAEQERFFVTTLMALVLLCELLRIAVLIRFRGMASQLRHNIEMTVSMHEWYCASQAATRLPPD